MPAAAVAAPLIGAAIGGLGSLFGGGGPTDFLNDDARKFIEDYQRTYGPQAFEDLVRQQGQFAGPLTEQFGPESIERFMNPFAEQARGRITAGADRSRLMASRGAREMAARTGSQRGSRAGVFEAERLGAVDRSELDALSNLDMGLYGQAFQGALGAQPFRNQFLQEPIMRHQLGMEALNFGLGPPQAFTNPRASEEQPNFLSGAIAGGIAGAGFGGGGGGGGGVIPSISVNPPQGILPVPGTNLSPGGPMFPGFNPQGFPPRFGGNPLGF